MPHLLEGDGAALVPRTVGLGQQQVPQDDQRRLPPPGTSSGRRRASVRAGPRGAREAETQERQRDVEAARAEGRARGPVGDARVEARERQQEREAVSARPGSRRAQSASPGARHSSSGDHANRPWCGENSTPAQAGWPATNPAPCGIVTNEP